MLRKTVAIVMDMDMATATATVMFMMIKTGSAEKTKNVQQPAQGNFKVNNAGRLNWQFCFPAKLKSV